MTLTHEKYVKKLIKAIHKALNPDLLSGKWKNVESGAHITTGHCYIAAEALYHLLGGKNAGLVAMNAREANGDTHWWLRHKDGRIMDPTIEQYTSLGLTPPYNIGKGGGFLTKLPSRRAQVLIDHVKEHIDVPVLN